MTGRRGAPIARQRRHTLYFLEQIRAFSPVFLDTDIDMTRVLEHRATARRDGRSYSVATYVMYAAGRALAAHPEANAAIRGHAWPRVARYETVNAKLTMDKTLGGQRVVLAAVLRDVGRVDLDEMQRQVDHYRDGDPAKMPEFARVLMLHKLPWSIGSFLFRSAARSLERRDELFGTVAVTSLGHRPVNGFHSVGGTTITLGVGQITTRPVAREGQLMVAPIMQLNLAFDHRVIDGAEAADVLADIKAGLEDFKAAEDTG